MALVELTTNRHPRGLAAIAAILLTGLVVAACGGESHQARQPAPGDIVRYCALSRQVNAAGAAPTPAQVSELIRLAPPEIRTDVTTYLNSHDASDDGVRASTRIIDYESSHC